MSTDPRPLTLAVAAEEAAGLQLLQALLRSPHRVAGVLASPTGPRAGGVSVWDWARGQGLPVWPAERVRDPAFANALRRAGAELMLNAHSLHIVHPAVLEALPLGGFNLHPGPLPAYAGLDAPSWALFHGETEHAATVHRMAAQVDAGPIAYMTAFPIRPTDVALNIYVACARLGVPLMLKAADTLARDPAALPALPIPTEGRRVFGRTPPNGGWIDWSWPAETIARFLRACDFGPFPSPWGTPLAALNGRRVGVARAAGTGPDAGAPRGAPPGAVVAVEPGGVRVAAGAGTLLVTHVAEDGRRRPAAEALSVGDRFETVRHPNRQPLQV